MRDEDILKLLESLLSIDEPIRESLLRQGSSLELQEIADRLGLSRKTLWKKKWDL